MRRISGQQARDFATACARIERDVCTVADIVWQTYGVTSKAGRNAEKAISSVSSASGYVASMAADLGCRPDGLPIRHTLPAFAVSLAKRLPLPVHCGLAHILRQDREELQTMAVAVANACGKTSTEASRLLKAERALDRLRCELDNRIVTEYPTESNVHHVYY